ncbi:hypothetical protein Ddye_027360 [Dipteronia dyeriana]|uniref:Peptidase A1 domain-containing protein n=1 Tax=Dipteronia dyeriana TaxID=168575 RepID=A0AAD9TPW4_9ROSI|nr:hypothetical protein Ddye_027360 [Dipteronia dyeriana]
MAYLSVLALISLCLLTISINFSDSKPVSGSSLKLIHIHSLAGNLSQLERVERLVKFSKAKEAYVQSLSTNSTDDHENPYLHYFYGTVGIGTPPVFVKLLIDTGSGLIWTQCEPCINCYDQGTRQYNSQLSNTYQILPCLPNQFSCINGECKYTMSYGDGGSSGTTKGSLSLESFLFSAGHDRGFTTMENIVFGCSNDFKGFNPFKGHIAGIMGLDLSKYSLNAQLQGRLGSRFSYCIVPFYTNDPTVSLLRFGDDIPLPKPTIQVQEINFYFIPIPGISYYFLKLIGISVGPTRLQFREDAITPHDQGGAAYVEMYMDTGNPYITQTFSSLKTPSTIVDLDSAIVLLIKESDSKIAASNSKMEESDVQADAAVKADGVLPDRDAQADATTKANGVVPKTQRVMLRVMLQGILMVFL